VLHRPQAGATRPIPSSPSTSPRVAHSVPGVSGSQRPVASISGKKHLDFSRFHGVGRTLLSSQRFLPCWNRSFFLIAPDKNAKSPLCERNGGVNMKLKFIFIRTFISPVTSCSLRTVMKRTDYR